MCGEKIRRANARAERQDHHVRGKGYWRCKQSLLGDHPRMWREKSRLFFLFTPKP